VTGSAGLIGSESVHKLRREGFKVVGIDNDMRSYFFGKEASTSWNQTRLTEQYGADYRHVDLDIRSYDKLEGLFQDISFDLIIHTAAQPSHDWAAKEPLTDFQVNALGTLNLLELTRKYTPEASFIFTSTNKVYGDNPNRLPFEEHNTRYELERNHIYWNGINENMSIDNCTHSIFGVSKTSADLLTQEYGRYFGLKTAVFRGGCLTGPMHSAAELHGFLAYLVKCIVGGKTYRIFGYKGKQVRDNIHANDLTDMFLKFHNNPKKNAVYNAGGGRANSISILEAIQKISDISGNKAKIEIEEKSRIGDHQWYVTDNSKFITDYPDWEITYSIDDLLLEMVGHAKSLKE
jgi:CDP-paratose 2-epimerase